MLPKYERKLRDIPEQYDLWYRWKTEYGEKARENYKHIYITNNDCDYFTYYYFLIINSKLPTEYQRKKSIDEGIKSYENLFYIQNFFGFIFIYLMKWVILFMYIGMVIYLKYKGLY